MTCAGGLLDSTSLVYGTPDRAKDLVRWNGGNPNWKAGRLLFYSAPKDPRDETMQSFYQERGVQPTEYQIQKGDWLSKLAKVKLGDGASGVGDWLGSGAGRVRDWMRGENPPQD